MYRLFFIFRQLFPQWVNRESGRRSYGGSIFFLGGKRFAGGGKRGGGAAPRTPLCYEWWGYRRGEVRPVQEARRGILLAPGCRERCRDAQWRRKVRDARRETFCSRQGKRSGGGRFRKLLRAHHARRQRWPRSL